jgi:uncharacterized protein (DUF488 family)
MAAVGYRPVTPPARLCFLEPLTIYTVGHSTRPLEELAQLLKANGVDLLVDVRTAPGSRRLPHFARAALAMELPSRGIGYMHLPELGGLRKPRPDSANTGWRNLSFRGYADYMATEPFTAGIDHLLALADGRRAAIMCAEAVPWRCHRSLIADALVARGVEVLDIIGPQAPRPHRMTPFAIVNRGRIEYPSKPDQPELSFGPTSPS